MIVLYLVKMSLNCPECGKEIQIEGSHYCPYCGVALARAFEKGIETIRNSLLTEQYKRCAEDWRYYDKGLWEIPFSTATVLGAILAIIYGNGILGGPLPSEAKVSILCCLLVFVTTMFFVARKFRFIQTGRTRFAEYIEEEIAKMMKVPMSTAKCIGFFKALKDEEGNRRLIKYRAVHFQNLLFLSFGAAIVYLLCREGFTGIVGLVLVGIVFCSAYFYDALSSRTGKYYRRLRNYLFVSSPSS
jgi:hypothetical protein